MNQTYNTFSDSLQQGDLKKTNDIRDQSQHTNMLWLQPNNIFTLTKKIFLGKQ